ncbi:putative (di)nucleoside polyphosphate hydrolase [Cohaesibacter marisflavi]|uniref:RNA pyrophosphohydrolase n=1 Tax=Cohaesibacter marisflavi TaxID=655353 RepID=A0A1I5JIQ8_9HYPH|nr:RNA pyrophosphohydrolase [Cohaesibacter marisflavi]SFO72236.1 putative (di)nucleoside polyphosphate hydrolase [Cohaesibacter marisflavi]
MAKKDNLPYRDCVGICLFNHENKVWIGNRYGASELENSNYTWQMPQGGIDKGEEPLQAAIRELYEETSIKSVSLIREAPDWLYYDFPDHVVKAGKIGKFKGQRQRWFAFRFEGDESEIEVINPAKGKHPQEFEGWRWEALAKTPDLIVPFKRDVYLDVVKAFADLAA